MSCVLRTWEVKTGCAFIYASDSWDYLIEIGEVKNNLSRRLVFFITWSLISIFLSVDSLIIFVIFFPSLRFFFVWCQSFIYELLSPSCVPNWFLIDFSSMILACTFSAPYVRLFNFLLSKQIWISQHMIYWKFVEYHLFFNLYKHLWKSKKKRKKDALYY